MLPQAPIPPRTDLRDMLRRHIVRSSLACMEAAAERRRAATDPAGFERYRAAIRDAVRGFYGNLPAGPVAPPPVAAPISAFAHDGFRVENVRFDSHAGWEVNATVFVPSDVAPSFPAVVVPVGHSGKQFASYQLPCQLFARAGYLAITFDPPGMSGEKQPGNDHFVDGARCWPVGWTSSRFFVADAVRCVDYLATRSDADTSRGVAMTGVSGGGTTTTLAALLDDRIAVLGPSCCVTPLADLDIAQCYAGCPETHMARRYAAGIDEVDLAAAAFPRPVLLMAGARDEVFRIEDTRRLADEVATLYRTAGAAERFAFFADDGGHAYSLAQAREFVAFMDRWLRGEPDRAQPAIPDDSFRLLPYDEMRCYPRTDTNMRSLATARAEMLDGSRDRAPDAVRRAAAEIAGVTGPVAAPEAEVGPPFRVWTHAVRQVMLRPEPGIELPATLVEPVEAPPAAVLVLFDDRGRYRLVATDGPFLRAIGFGDAASRTALFTVDLRGWGDTAPAVYPYELAGWGSVDRWTAYASVALGDPVLAMRMRDGLSALAFLRSREGYAGARTIVAGMGLGGVVALHVAAIDSGVASAFAGESPVSFRSLVEAERYAWPADAFLPDILERYDLPDLAAALPCPVFAWNSRDGSGAPTGGPDQQWDDAVRALRGMLAG